MSDRSSSMNINVHGNVEICLFASYSICIIIAFTIPCYIFIVYSVKISLVCQTMTLLYVQGVM